MSGDLHKHSKVRQIVIGVFKEKFSKQNISEKDNFFDLGVSSLSIVELQIKIEKLLDLNIATSELMKRPSIMEWIDIYTNKYKEYMK